MKRSLTLVLAGALTLLASLAVGVTTAWARLDPGGAGTGSSYRGYHHSAAVASGGNGALIVGLGIVAVVAAVVFVLIAVRARRRPAAATSPVDLPERKLAHADQPAEPEQSHQQPKAA